MYHITDNKIAENAKKYYRDLLIDYVVANGDFSVFRIGRYILEKSHEEVDEDIEKVRYDMFNR